MKRVPKFVASDGLIEEILETWSETMGVDARAYRGHVYRVFNFSCILAGDNPDRRTLAVAAAFHDLAIWSDRTFDYLAPSAARARAFIVERGLGVDVELVERSILAHHKLRRLRDVQREPEAIRRADLVDLSFGLVRFGLSKDLIKEARAMFPNAGFHRCLLRVACCWSVRHPLRPLPMLRW